VTRLTVTTIFGRTRRNDDDGRGHDRGGRGAGARTLLPVGKGLRHTLPVPAFLELVGHADEEGVPQPLLARRAFFVPDPRLALLGRRVVVSLVFRAPAPWRRPDAASSSRGALRLRK
jgi:hypothetical protein